MDVVKKYQCNDIPVDSGKKCSFLELYLFLETKLNVFYILYYAGNK